ncbi:hypothetical protein KNV00_gp159 [Streptomyces phage Bmoc]|uniref:Uncharacterized protein n=1 Tax=Streptomyces phage Bmoc TaxID=2725629 RepID=A0A6M3T059_9CAUD|nr:hypothetical protein KNV00_gp159 [Streptomyces phage Bmoc]QJD50860.1 hypothetical protein SEA_BMOC_121 [Streptomyces phage Bmoc]
MIGHPAESMFDIVRTLIENSAELADDVRVTHLEIRENNGSDSILP